MLYSYRLRSIIVVDDEEDCRCSLQESLELLGIDVVATGADGEEAFKLYEEYQPDVVILDMNMPKYDGNYAIEKIKSKYPDSKIVVVTAYSNYSFDRTKVEGIISKNHVDGIMTKPYDVKELVSLIQKICSPINPKQALWYVG